MNLYPIYEVQRLRKIKAHKVNHLAEPFWTEPFDSLVRTESNMNARREDIVADIASIIVNPEQLQHDIYISLQQLAKNPKITDTAAVISASIWNITKVWVIQ